MFAEDHWYVIINPTSGNGSSKRQWPKIERLFKAYGFTYSSSFTQFEKHSIELVQDAVFQGFKKFIVIGGDGTIHNVVNGIMSQKKVPSKEIVFGVVPIGTGNDWVKSYKIPQQIEGAVEVINSGVTSQQDIGELVFLDRPAEPIYFNNLAGIGYDGYVVHKIGKYKRFGALAYFIGALLGLISAKNFKAELKIDQANYSVNALMVLIGLCQYSGGGMQLTDNSDPYDGLFDISIATNFKALDVLVNLPKLFSGKITQHRKIITKKASNIRVLLKEGATPYVQADGELIGAGAFEVRLIKGGITFITP